MLNIFLFLFSIYIAPIVFNIFQKYFLVITCPTQEHVCHRQGTRFAIEIFLCFLPVGLHSSSFSSFSSPALASTLRRERPGLCKGSLVCEVITWRASHVHPGHTCGPNTFITENRYRPSAPNTTSRPLTYPVRHPPTLCQRRTSLGHRTFGITALFSPTFSGSRSLRSNHSTCTHANYTDFCLPPTHTNRFLSLSAEQLFPLTLNSFGSIPSISDVQIIGQIRYLFILSDSFLGVRFFLMKNNINGN